MTILSLRIAKLTPPLLLLTLLSGAAQATQQCGGGGYIKSVALNHNVFRDPNVIGISVKHDDGTTRNYYTYQSTDVGNFPETRSLLQLATTAYISQAHVYVYVSQNCNYTYKEADGRTWVTRWNGLWLDGN